MRACILALVGGALVFSDPPPPPVRLDVVVSGASGAAIAGLAASDFELKEDGVVRPISSVEMRTGGARVFAFVLDEFHVAAGEPSARVRESLAAFVTTHLRPDDLAVAIRPLDTVADVSFTRDREGLLAAIRSFEGRKGDLEPRSSFERQFIGHAPAAIDAARTQIVSASLREVSLRMGDLTADRGVIVLVSEGLARAPVVRQTRVPDLQGVVRAASHFHLAVYTYSPADRDAAAPLSSDQSTLEWLANETGGRAALDGSSFDRALARMAADLDNYYAVTYQPAKADGRFHALQLVTRRKGADVKVRPGYWASLSREVRALMDPPSTPAVRRSLKRSTTVSIWTGVTLGADGRTRLSVTWEPRTSQRAVTVAVKAATPGGQSLFEGRLAPANTGGATEARVATFDVPAGTIELDMLVQAVTGETIDTDTRDVQVPDFSTRPRGPVILTPEVIRGRTAPEFRALVADPLAPPTPSRDFTRGDRLLINVPVWSPGGAPVQLTATVTNALGGAMRTVPDARPQEPAGRFELPLAWLAPGNYQVVFTARDASGETSQAVRFSVR
ncbi:MAG TPA: VWA domain-containing protein [Vicinamibacterales bacterium]